MEQACCNPWRQESLPPRLTEPITSHATEARKLHRSLPEYQPTGLVTRPDLAAALGLGEVLVKDESTRFGLQAFKALGATYAIYRWLREKLPQRGQPCPPPGDFYRDSSWLEPDQFTFCTATDGNHGRGVAWVAQKLGQQAVIYMPRGTVPARVAAIRDLGAQAAVVDGDYDQAVAIAGQQAAQNGWQVVSDTSWSGYETVPGWIAAGYLTMFGEIDQQLEGRCPDAVIVPGGVGALAAAAAAHFHDSYGRHRPRLVCVEPVGADCLYRSIGSHEGNPTVVPDPFDSIMAGLNCGTPSPVAWPLLKHGFDSFVTIDDDYARRAMRMYFHASDGNKRVVSGESGAASLGALIAMTESDRLSQVRQSLGLGPVSTVLLLSTEGDTDPAAFQSIVQD